MDLVSKYLKGSGKGTKALVICAEKFSTILDPDNPTTAFCLSDSAFAFIVENDGDATSGLIDVLYHKSSEVSEKCKNR